MFICTLGYASARRDVYCVRKIKRADVLYVRGVKVNLRVRINVVIHLEIIIPPARIIRKKITAPLQAVISPQFNIPPPTTA